MRLQRGEVDVEVVVAGLLHDTVGCKGAQQVVQLGSYLQCKISCMSRADMQGW